MARGLIDFQLKGQDKLERRLSEFFGDMENGAKNATETSTKNIYSNSRANAPVDTGELKGSGYYKISKKGLSGEIGFTAPHAPYLEFGTGGYVDVPEGFAEYAIQFKGAGIKKVNIHPQPYLIPAWLKEHPVYLRNLQKVISEAKRKFRR